MNILEKIVEQKKKELSLLPSIDESEVKKSDQDFYKAVKKKGDLPNLIAEIKPASPSRGRILPADANIEQIAKNYAENKVVAISVLSDEKFFQASFQNLSEAKKGAPALPIFCKDFIISNKQIHRARQHGADSFLLIAAILTVKEIQTLLDEGRKWNMEAMVEIADEEDLEKILQTDAKIIGINNRNLKDFRLNLSRSFLLKKKLPKEAVVVSLSGFSGSDILLVKNICDAILVGSSLCAAENIAEQINNFHSPAPLIKFCGLRHYEDFLLSQNLGINLIGLNFVSWSKRQISPKIAEKITQNKSDQLKLVGVFYNQERQEVEKICQHYNLDFCQLSGEEHPQDWQDFPLAIIKGISVKNQEQADKEMKKWNQLADLFLFDAKVPGSGQTFSTDLLPKNINKPFFIAGGINEKNAQEILKKTGAIGIDLASAIEDEAGNWSEKKMTAIIKTIV